MITLTDGTTTIELNPDLMWSDEYTWSPVRQVSRYKVSGALSIHVSRCAAGRPITLTATDEYGWPGMTGRIVRQLRTWADTVGQQLTLTLRGEQFSVVFRHQDAPACEPRPVGDYSDPSDDDLFIVTLKFMVI